MRLNNVINTNYSDDSIALLAYLKQVKIPATVVSIDTGLAAPSWLARVAAGEAYARTCGFAVYRLVAKQSFVDLVTTRKQFPNKKFQWCAGLLKGMTLLSWLDEVDPDCTASILLAKRRSTSRQLADLPLVIENSEHYGERRVVHPIAVMTDAIRDHLLTAAGFTRIPHRSLECDPCIHSLPRELAQLAPSNLEKIAQLEAQVGNFMFAPTHYEGAEGIAAVVRKVQNGGPASQLDDASSYYEVFDMGCGSPFACGV